MRWSANIALSLGLISVFAAAAYADSASDVQQGAAAAATSGTTMRSYTGTGPALSNNLITPLVQASQITTVDGKTKFITNGFQSSGKPLIQITLNPDPATGDLKNIILQQDLTGSGTLNYALTFPMPGDGPGQEIAGVCQNGYIQCNAGFTNCQYRAWTYGANGAVTATTASGGQAGTPGSVGSLSGCYCFDNFCTGRNSALIEMGVIGSDVGGGILSAFLAANTGMAISNASSGNNTAGSVVLTYYGYKPATVSKGSDTTTMTPAQVAAMPAMSPADTQTPQTYYSDSASLNAAAQTALTSQKNAPNSLYSIVTNASLSQVGTTVTCTNSVQPALSSVTLTSQPFTGSTPLSIDDAFSWSLTETSQNVFVFTGVDNKGWQFPSITYNVQPPGTLGGYVVQSVSFVGGWPDGSGGCPVFTFSPVWTAAAGIGTSITGSTNSVCPSRGYQYPTMDWTFTAQYVTQTENDVSNTGCSQYENNSNCTLQQDVWDGRPVVVNGLKMNNQQVGQTCKTIPGVGPLPAATVCKAWFVQNRMFFCKDSTTYDFSTIKSNAATIENSTSMPTNSSFRYVDPTQGNATITYGAPTSVALPACSQVCETKVPLSQSGVGFTGVAQSSNQTTATQSATQYLFYYKDCVSDTSGNWSCPNNTANGEIIITQCGCSADMSNALGALNAAGSMSQDAICAAQ